MWAADAQEVSEDLAPYGEWAERLRRPNKREKKVPLLSRDAFEGRPLSFLQRLRGSSVPVVESNPTLSIDDAGKHTGLLASLVVDCKSSDLNGQSAGSLRVIRRETGVDSA